VKVRGETVRGRLVDVLDPEQSVLEDCVGGTGEGQPAKPCATRRAATVLVLAGASEIRRFAAADLGSVQPLDPGAKSRFDAALDAVSRRSAQTAREIRVMARGGEAVSLGYVAETPVWRATYRLVLDTQDRASLQGWALIHNDTDEAWKGVRVELVNGRPDAFLFPLAAPRYAKRELVTPERELSTVPQLFDRPADEMWATGDIWGDEVGDAYGAGGLGLSGIGEGGGGRGEGIALGAIGTLGHGAGTGSSELAIGSLAALGRAEGVEAGALFRYALASPVDLRPHGSALVPFAEESVRARRIAWFAAPGGEARSAVHFVNQTRQTLPPGTVAVFADGGFAGEAAIRRLKPGESQLVRFGTDLDVELTQERDNVVDRTQLVTVRGDQLVVHFLRQHRITYRIANRSGAGRTVYLQLPFVDNARVEGADELAYDSEAKAALGVFQVPAQKERRPELRVDEGLSRALSLLQVGPEELRRLAAASGLHPAQRPILERAIALQEQAAAVRARIADRQSGLARMKREVEQIRLDLAALRRDESDASESLAQRLLDSQAARRDGEARVDRLHAEASALEASARTQLGHLNAAAKRPRK
jgi:hypothetical protein